MRRALRHLGLVMLEAMDSREPRDDRSVSCVLGFTDGRIQLTLGIRPIATIQNEHQARLSYSRRLTSVEY